MSEFPPTEPVDFWLNHGPRDEDDSKAFSDLNKFPWFHSFRRSLFFLDNQEGGDSLGQPFAIGLVALLSEPNLVSTLRALAVQHTQGDIPKIFIVVGDGHLSSDLAVADLTPLILISPSNPQPGATLFLQTVLDLTEKRVFALNQVAAKMKSLRNALKSWFGRPEPSTSQQAGDAIKVRLLADILFLLRDYETAMSTYAVVRDDYIGAESYLKVGSAFEMMALCSFMQHKERLAEYVDRALDAFGKVVVFSSPEHSLRRRMRLYFFLVLQKQTQND